MSDDRDGLERLLRDTLDAQAQTYEPRGDGLTKIRERVTARHPWRRWLVPSAAVAGVAAAIAAVLLAVPLLGTDRGPQPAPPVASQPAASPLPSPAASPPASPPAASGSPAPAQPSGSPASQPATRTHAVAVYYTGSTSAGPRLFREFHPEPVSRSPIRDAVNALLQERPRDGDYSSAWPAGTGVLGVSVHGTEITVDLTAAPPAPIAAQQLVWTVAAAHPPTTAVRVLVHGQAAGAPITKAAATDVLAPVWVLAPEQGATVDRTFSVSGTASVFEGAVSWQLRRADGSVVRDGSVQASVGAPGRGGWGALTLTAPAAGRYTFVASASSPKDGSPLASDSKTFTVR